MRWGEVAHILPASPQGPRAHGLHTATTAAKLTHDPKNLMLLCPACHTKVDRDAAGYPVDDLSGLHAAFLQRIAFAVTWPSTAKALPLIVLGKHFKSRAEIRNRDLLAAMSSEGLIAVSDPLRVELDAPMSSGRDARYWERVNDQICVRLPAALRKNADIYGDAPAIAVAGLADIPALMAVGRVLGDRTARHVFSPNRTTGLAWPDLTAAVPVFQYAPPSAGKGPLALLLSLSAEIPRYKVEQALPGARCATFSVASPTVHLVQNRNVIHAFRDVLQPKLSELEASTSSPIHVFAAIPAALAIEFGALHTMQHQHPYVVYDLDNAGAYVPSLSFPS
jgi:hypothetical protein